MFTFRSIHFQLANEINYIEIEMQFPPADPIFIA